MRRAFKSIVLAGCLLVAPDVVAEDGTLDIIQRALEAARANEVLARQYVFHERVEEIRFDKEGREKDRRSRTWDVSRFSDGELRRLIARDGQPLTAREAAKEQRKIDRHIEKVRKETPRQRARRLAKLEKQREEALEFFEELTRAFDFRTLREETVNGVPTYVIAADPKKGYRPTSRRTKALTKVRATLWVARDDYGWVQAEIETLEDINWLLLKLGGGSKVTLRQRKIDDEVWMTDQWQVRFNARIALVRRIRAELNGSYSNFRRFTTETEITGVRARTEHEE